MLMSQRIDLAFVGRQLCRVRLSGQDASAQDLTALGTDKANKVCESPALSDEVVDDEVCRAMYRGPGKKRLIGKSLEPICSGVADRPNGGVGVRGTWRCPLAAINLSGHHEMSASGSAIHPSQPKSIPA